MSRQSLVLIWSSPSAVICSIMCHLEAFCAFIKTYQNDTKHLKSLRMVPRAGLEPARPMLSNPRILSPEHNQPKYLIIEINSNFKSKNGPRLVLTRYAIIGQIAPFVRLFHKWNLALFARPVSQENITINSQLLGGLGNGKA